MLKSSLFKIPKKINDQKAENMRFLNPLAQTIIFTLFLTFLLLIIRICFVLYVGIYQHFMGDVGFYEIIKYLFIGLEYDNRYIGMFSLVYFLIAELFVFFPSYARFLNIYACIIFTSCLLLGISEMLFYQIYTDGFNATLFELINNDTIAIIKTGFSGEYGVVSKIFFWIAASFIYCIFYTKATRVFGCFLTISKKYVWMLFVFIGLLNICALIYTVSVKNKLDDTLLPPKDVFLKRTEHGFLRDIYKLLGSFNDNKSLAKMDFSTEKELKISQDYFDIKTPLNPPVDIYSLISHTSTNTSHTKIKHIFYIISESFSNWAFDDLFDNIGLTSGLKSLIDNKHGFKLEYFLENAPCTTRSLGVQLTGVAQTDFLLYKLLGRFSSFATSPGNIFHALGYESTFYYGGNSRWGDFGEIAKIQNFDKTYDALNILEFAKGKKYQKHIKNEWGAHDNILFDFIEQNVSKNSKPTFNMIMTSSVHPPYDVDLDYFNVPMQKIQKFWEENFPKNKRTHGMDANILGHIWWYDKQVTHFILKMSEAFPDSLFVITADHYGRISPIPTNKPSIIKTVPFILYSPILSPKQLANIGAHIDITPTIVELVSPKGFQYQSFGKPLFSNNQSLPFEPNAQALGFEVVGNDRFLYTPDFGLEYLSPPPREKSNLEADENLAKKMYQKRNELDDLSLYLLIKGPIIK